MPVIAGMARSYRECCAMRFASKIAPTKSRCSALALEALKRNIRTLRLPRSTREFFA